MTLRRALAAVVVVSTCTLAFAVVSTAPVAAAPRAESYSHTVSVAISDIQDFWVTTFPKIYGGRYDPVPSSRIFAGHPGVKLPHCNGERLSYRDVAGNAFYCLHDNFVAYDDTHLFPELYAHFGPFAVALVLAHEFGHAVQDRAGVESDRSVVQELQADCFAGAWTDDVAENGSPVQYD